MAIKSLLALLAPIALFLSVAAQAAEPAAAAGSGPPSFVVDCYDRARDVVTRTLTSDCAGTIITGEEARKVRERQDSRRAARMRASRPVARSGAKLVSIGTAFYVDERGKLVTNNHVIAHCDAVTIMSDAQRDMDVSVTATDVASDLALLESASPAPGYAVFEGSPVRETPVATVGFPDEGLPPIEPLLTTGRLLKADSAATPVAHVIIRADVRHGNSGSPIFDRYDRVLGIISAKVNTPRVYSETHREITDVGIGIGLPSLLRFLAAHGVQAHVENGGPAASPESILARARAFVVRVNCWKKSG